MQPLAPKEIGREIHLTSRERQPGNLGEPVNQTITVGSSIILLANLRVTLGGSIKDWRSDRRVHGIIFMHRHLAPRKRWGQNAPLSRGVNRQTLKQHPCKTLLVCQLMFQTDGKTCEIRLGRRRLPNTGGCKFRVLLWLAPGFLGAQRHKKIGARNNLSGMTICFCMPH